jgi:hypothetical protein
VLLFDRFSWPSHRRWAAFISVATLFLLAIALYGRIMRGAWLGGGSWLGLPAGLAAAAICVFEFLLWPRKWFRTLRVGSARAWMRAHIWLGLLTVPLVLVHSGFGEHHHGHLNFGGPLTTALAVVFIVVIGSGVWGLGLQQILPRHILEELPRETIYAQIDHVGGILAQEAAYLVLTTCGPEPGRVDLQELDELSFKPGTPLYSHLTRNSVSTTKRGPISHVPNAEALRHYLRDAVRPYLERGVASHSPLRLATQARNAFNHLRKRLPLAAHPTVAALEDLCDQRRQIDRQARLHFWLHCWLWLHLPLSGILMVLMTVHAVTCWIYW